MNYFKRFQIIILTVTILFLGLCVPDKVEAAKDDELVVVIDPGHGGENLGANYDGYLEKEMNLIVANAMYEELTKYEGIKVYMTRSDDEDLSLLERAEFAESVDADFLFCLHFNMSVSHKKYGAEVWVSAFGDPYAKAYSFAQIQMQELIQYGLFDRGVKTRLNDKGQDYYGIIRHCTKFGIPSVIIEHAHLDHEKDTKYLKSKEDLVYLGVLDATAVAKYYGLSSKKLGVDYSEHPRQVVDTPINAVKPDSTDPDVVYIDESSIKDEGDKVTFTVNAQDYDSPLQYYAFSLNGGDTFGELYEWTGGESMEISFQKPQYGEIELSVVVFNRYDLYSVSNEITLEIYQDKMQENDDADINETEKNDTATAEEDSFESSEEEIEVVNKDAIVVKKDMEQEEQNSLQKGLVIALFITGSILVLLLTLKIVYSMINKKNKRGRSNKHK